MVFLIQNSQTRDAAAIQVKLDELIRVRRAHNSFVGVEHLTDEEAATLPCAGVKRTAGDRSAKPAPSGRYFSKGEP